MEERLQKIIARAGICSRREAEEMIQEGRVTVNGDIVTELGTRADASSDHIKVDGKLLQVQDKFFYILLNKPKGVISTVSDPEGRPCVTDLIKGIKARIYPVGRLDFNTEGVLLLTNDGDLTNKLLRPRSRCPKTYIVKVHGVPEARALDRLRRGITVDGTRYGACEIEMLRTANNAWLKVTLYEGKNQQIRKIFESIGHPVAKLKRIGFAFLTARDLAAGDFRELTETEIARLTRDDYKPLVPINPAPFLKEYGVRITLADKERNRAYRPGARGEEEERHQRGGSRERSSDKNRGIAPNRKNDRWKDRGSRDDRDERGTREDRPNREERGPRSRDDRRDGARGDRRDYRGERGRGDRRDDRRDRGDRDRGERRDYRSDRERGDRDRGERRDYRGDRERGDRRDGRDGGRGDRERSERRDYRGERGRSDRRDSREGGRGDRERGDRRDGGRGRDTRGRDSRDARGRDSRDSRGRDNRESRGRENREIGSREDRGNRNARGDRREGGNRFESKRPGRGSKPAGGRGGRPSSFKKPGGRGGRGGGPKGRGRS